MTPERRHRSADWTSTRPGHNGDPETSIRFDGRRVRTQGVEPAIDVDIPAFQSGKHDAAIAKAFGVDAVVTLHALVSHDLNPERAPRRPRLKTLWRANVGDKWASIRLSGRALEVRVQEPGLGMIALPIDDIEISALPEDYASRVDPGAWADAVDMARVAATLECYCGTGFEQASEHNALIDVKRKVDPRVPLDNATSSHVCRVCGRGWLLSYAGDSHYSYNYQAHWIDPMRRG